MIPQRALGTTGLWVSALGFGGAPIGFDESGSEDALVVVLRRALAGGVTFFDTAPVYRQSEALLCRALAQVDRSSVVIATKVGRTQHHVGGVWQPEVQDWSETAIRASVEESLRRLGAAHVDLVQLHSPPLEVVEAGDAQQTLERIRDEGLARHIGLSADGAIARRAVERGGFETLQLSASILQEEPLAMAGEAARRGMGVIAKQPLANGIAVATVRPGHPDWARKWDIAARLDWDGYLARASGAGTETGGQPRPPRRLAIALRFMLSQEAVATSIVGTANPAHLDANLRAASEGPLDAALVRRIRADYSRAAAGLAQTEP